LPATPFASVNYITALHMSNVIFRANDFYLLQ